MARVNRTASRIARLAKERKKGNQVSLLERDIGRVRDSAMAASDNWKTWGAGGAGYLGGVLAKKGLMYGLGALGTAASGGLLGPILLNPAFQMAVSTGAGMLPSFMATKAGEEVAGMQTQKVWDDNMGKLTNRGIRGHDDSAVRQFANDQVLNARINAGSNIGTIASLANVASDVGSGLGKGTSAATSEAAGEAFIEESDLLQDMFNKGNLTTEQAGIISNMDANYRQGMLDRLSKGDFTSEQIEQITSNYNAPLGSKVGSYISDWWSKK